ncbi:hypothetical protein Pcinc_001824 [Petrolisthes cinctipes]|uniref:Ionotropic glutamate receptor L-glutamate and glycine-binding domain-containing protein n=1 Tax=Petrolisthes cinctipes TaxID=88211 RepID=A0AAE1KD94_PETCI|nr:hypothetical protein Pcinc_024251 [Petrolisthes cinctipes]KAK3894415.1 hypothetical protein Pcinc_001824 [Petrolisthes cinctipes]
MCWSLFYLASTLAINPELWEQQVSRLGEMVTGPAQNMSLIIQFDPDLPSDVQRTVLQEVRHVPHLILPLGHNFTLWMSPHNCLHIALLTRKHQMLVSYPPPRHLLLLALDSEVDASLLKEVGSRVKSLAFISMNGAVYTLLPFFSPRPVLLGQWHPKHFPVWNSLFKNRFLHFYHHTFHLAGWNADRPFLYTSNLNGGIHAGVAVEMLNSLSGPLNFTYTLTKEPPDLQWGNYINEKWTGLLGMVDSGEKYFTVNNLYPSPERQRDFDMSPPCWADSFAAFLLQPLPLPAWSNMHRPFTFPVWSAFVAIMVPAHLFLYLHVSTATISLTSGYS